MPCIYDFGFDDEEPTKSAKQYGSQLGEVIHSIFFQEDKNDDGSRNKLSKLGRQLLALNFEIDCTFIQKIRMILGLGKGVNMKEVEDEFGYLVDRNEYMGIAEVDTGLESSKMLLSEDCKILESLLNLITLGKKDKKKEIIVNKKSMGYDEFSRNHVICSVFEFIPTKDLIESCSLVCKCWSEMIIEDVDSTEQIFGNRFKILANQNSLDFESVCEMHSSCKNWMEIYMLSGMFHLEIAPNYHKWISLTDSSVNLLLLNPLVYLDLEPNHFLIDRFCYFKRFLIVPEWYNQFDIRNSELMQKYKSKQFTDCVFQLSDSKIALCNILQSPIILPPQERIFSLEFESGVPIYLNLLKAITGKLAHIVKKSHSGIIATYLDLMLEKAHHFLEHVSEFNNYRVGVDVLIGLHLIFLDRYYLGDNLLAAPFLNFGRLLNNFNTNQGTLFDTYPESYENDLFNEMVFSLNEHQKTWFPSPNSIFKHELNAFEFLQEHIFELSIVSEPIPELTKQYLQLIQIEEASFPNKSSDLILHYHLLHPQHYINDCYRLHPNNRIKFHDFNFPYHHNPHFTFNYQLTEKGWNRCIEVKDNLY